jgi:hypothetical protein
MVSWTYTRSSFVAVAAGSSKTRGSSRPEMPTKPHTRWPGSICTAKANAGRFGYASGGLGTEAHRGSCFTPPEHPRRLHRILWTRWMSGLGRRPKRAVSIQKQRSSSAHRPAPSPTKVDHAPELVPPILQHVGASSSSACRKMWVAAIATAIDAPPSDACAIGKASNVSLLMQQLPILCRHGCRNADGRPSRCRGRNSRPLCARSCCATTTLSDLLLGWKAAPKFSLRGKGGSPVLWPWGNCMGENLLLLSCGAAFITGLVIAAASLFG